MARRAGVDIAPEEMEAILRKLMFTVERQGDAMTVTAPASPSCFAPSGVRSATASPGRHGPR